MIYWYFNKETFEVTKVSYLIKACVRNFFITARQVCSLFSLNEIEFKIRVKRTAMSRLVILSALLLTCFSLYAQQFLARKVSLITMEDEQMQAGCAY